MTTNTDQARTEFRDFLGSVKTAEAISREVREAMTVSTGLEGALAGAILRARSVVIAGSAGSGKTHLLESLRAEAMEGLPTLHTWMPGGASEPESEPFVRVVEDATAVLDDWNMRDHRRLTASGVW